MSRDLTSSAPGKIMLTGEYAVLHGYPALLMAVDRRAVAQADASPVPSPFLQAVSNALASRFGPEDPRTLISETALVDSSAFSDSSGAKLGIGSSAAVTVAAVALALGDDRQQADWRDLVHAIAHQAHGDAQAAMGARGSGADVAASCWGGVVSVQARDNGLCPRVSQLSTRTPSKANVLPLASRELELVAVWTGISADTRTLVAGVTELVTRAPKVHARHMARLGQNSENLAAALAGDDLSAAIACFEDGRRAIAELGTDSGVALVPEVLQSIGALATGCGGAAKTAGAGGGDLVLVALPDSLACERFRAQVEDLGMKIVDLRVDTRGVEASRVAPVLA